MNMPCQRCHEAKATVHITDTVPEQRERHLCEDCAEKEGVIQKQHATTNEILQQFIKQKAGLGSTDTLSCPQCGITFTEFQLKGQLGCAHDYVAFQSVLKPLIQRAHAGALQHAGKSPANVDQSVRKLGGLRRLRRELEEAIGGEDYELAARVRDRITKMESE